MRRWRAAAIQRGQLRADSPAFAAFTIVAGVSFVSRGPRRVGSPSERWTGALMVGAGFALFAGTLVQANRSLPFTVGLAATRDPAAVLAHLVLAFPDGRLHSIWERLIVGAAYLNAVVVQIVMLMFMGIEQVGGCPCPHNLLFVRDDMNVHMTADEHRAVRRHRGRGSGRCSCWLCAGDRLASA